MQFLPNLWETDGDARAECPQMMPLPPALRRKGSSSELKRPDRSPDEMYPVV